ncbi:MAG: ECF-type sigma factor [Pseudomonadota bacterium]
MDDNNLPDIQGLLDAANRGDDGAFEKLTQAIYPELKKIAHFQLAGERADHTLSTTAVVHEAFLRLNAGKREWSGQNHLLRAAAAVMRHLLVDHARRRQADKRGAGIPDITLKEDQTAAEDQALAVLKLDRALEDMAEIDPRLQHIVECRYFAGLSVSETADAVGRSLRTVERDLSRARAYLRQHLEIDE